jgi:hypothetical protein
MRLLRISGDLTREYLLTLKELLLMWNLPWNENSAMDKLVILKYKRLRIRLLKDEVRNSWRVSKAQYGSRIGYEFRD